MTKAEEEALNAEAAEVAALISRNWRDMGADETPRAYAQVMAREAIVRFARSRPASPVPIKPTAS